MKKIDTIAACAALAFLAACSGKVTETVDVPADETAAAQVQLNEDGSVNTDATVGSRATTKKPTNPDEKLP